MSSTSSLPGVRGTLGLTNDPLRGHRLTLDGKPAPRENGAYRLPATEDGAEPVAVKLRGRFFSEHPVLTVGEHSYHTGPAGSPFLLVIAFLPVLFLFGGSYLGPVFMLLTIAFNLWILRTRRAEAWKTGVILAAFMGMVLVQFVWAFFYSWILSLLPR